MNGTFGSLLLQYTYIKYHTGIIIMSNNQIVITLDQLVEHVWNLNNGIYPEYPFKYPNGGEDGSCIYSVLPFKSTNKVLEIDGINYELMDILANDLSNTFLPVKLKEGLWDGNNFIGPDIFLRKSDVYAYLEDDESGHTMKIDEAFQEYATKSIEMPFLPTYLSTEKYRTPLIALMEFAIAGFIVQERYTFSLYNVTLREYLRFLALGFISPIADNIYATTVPHYDILVHKFEKTKNRKLSLSFAFLIDRANKRLHYMGYDDFTDD